MAKVDSLFPSEESVSKSDMMWSNLSQTVHSDLKSVYLVISKITRYFVKKEENTKKYTTLADEENLEAVQIMNPIFDTLKEPSQYEVGNVISLNCGHAMRPSDHEANLIH